MWWVVMGSMLTIGALMFLRLAAPRSSPILAFTGYSSSGVLVFLGAALIWQAGPQVLAGWQSLSWTPTKGHIVNVDIIRTGSPQRLETVTYSPMVLYRYEVDGKQLGGHTLGFGWDTLQPWDPSWAESVRARYPNNREVPVYVDPEEPGRSVLEPGIMSFAAVQAFAGIALLLVGTVGIALRMTTPKEDYSATAKPLPRR